MLVVNETSFVHVCKAHGEEKGEMFAEFGTKRNNGTRLWVNNIDGLSSERRNQNDQDMDCK